MNGHYLGRVRRGILEEEEAPGSLERSCTGETNGANWFGDLGRDGQLGLWCAQQGPGAKREVVGGREGEVRVHGGLLLPVALPSQTSLWFDPYTYKVDGRPISGPKGGSDFQPRGAKVSWQQWGPSRV